MKAWRVKQLGAPNEALSVEEVERPTVADNLLLIKVKAAAVNNNDLNKLSGSAQFAMPELPFTLGMEVCGEVVEAGQGLESWIGQRVCAATQLSVGAYAEFALASVDMTFPAPAQLSDEAAAGFVVPFHTAYLLLIKRAALAAGETVLIHGGSGGVGSAAIQLAKARGAVVIATVSSQGKADYCLSLGADHVIEHSEDFAARAMEITADKGVDVVFDLVGGELRDKSLTCMAIEGRYVAAGFCGEGTPSTAQDVEFLRKVCAMNISVIGGLFAWRSNPEPFLRQFGLNPFDNHVGIAIHTALCEHLDAGAIEVKANNVIDFSELPEALSALQARTTIGKTIMRI